MKKAIALVLLFFAVKVYADDTARLQAMLDAGKVTLPANHAPYTITSINLTHSLNANGNVIRCLTDDQGIVMTKTGVKLSNAEIVGLDDTTNPSGASGIQLNGDRDTVDHVYIHKFPAYGIIGGDGNRPVITNNKIADIGYMGIFLFSTHHSIRGGIVASNTFDRSMLNPNTVTEGDIMLRGTPSFASSGWKVYRNTMLMPIAPKDLTAMCMELRNTPYSQVYDNTFIGGTIGVSIVRNNFVTVYNNKCMKQREEGIEVCDSENTMVRDNIITDQLNMGIMVDGFAPLGNKFDTLLNNTISRCNGYGIQLFKDTYNTHIRNCTITTKSKAINIQGAHTVTVQDCILTGNGYGSTAIFLDNSKGKITMKGGSMKGFERKLFIYTNKQVKTDDILIDGVKGSDNMGESDKNLSGGGEIGSNIRIK